MTDDISEEPQQRNWATVAAGGAYILMAISAGYLMNVFAALPDVLIYSLAGIALFGSISSSLQQAVIESKVSEASVITFLVTASDIMLWGMSSILWGLIAGGLVLFIQSVFKEKSIIEC